jgi:transposase
VSAHAGADTNTGEFAAHRVSGAAFEAWGKDGNRECGRVGHQQVHMAGWGQFVKIIAEKADRYGRTVNAVSRWLASSKTCSTCGHRLAELPLQVRTWTCPCGAVHDRDCNAAQVILAAGRAERLNDRGARVRPQPVAALGVETGSTPTAA